MGIFAKLFGKKSDTHEVSHGELLDAGICPNCWGREDYNGEFTQYVKDQTKSNINHDKFHKKAFIQQFVETNVSGIKLKKENDGLICRHCNVSHKHPHAHEV